MFKGMDQETLNLFHVLKETGPVIKKNTIDCNETQSRILIIKFF